ncbi:hypothetical protein FVR03_16740 [Pontibacter qinzhouensis]|uniref:Uncharacterized protein n=1 Tax=Pontibacter qinzhouensis TaxID=2603253 RepID=A0A5C8JGC8_9BACT|nr:hypothetical protein [Pontibacter qinzhouensis]TXK36789.1 hypothetical protein FVR03_16740 [Pontibacter qinzhouensis]
MRKIEIFIDGKIAHLSEQLKVVIDTKVVSEFRNPLKKTGALTYSVIFPPTQNNKVVFDFQNERQLLGKFRKEYACEVQMDGITVIDGTFIIERISKNGFEGFIVSNNGGRISDIISEDKKLKEITSFASVDFEGDKTVWEYLDKDVVAENSEIAFPYVVDSFARVNSLSGATVDGIEYNLGYENFGVSHFTKAVFKNIFKDAGYELEGNILNDETFRRLLLLYTSNGDSASYNYGVLNPLNCLTVANYLNPAPIYEFLDYNIYAIEPEKYELQSGDLSFSLGRDGVYTCKYTSNYTFDIKVKSYVYDAATNTNLETKQFLLFREIGDSEYSEELDGLTNTFTGLSAYSFEDRFTLNTGASFSTVSGNVHTHTSSFTARLTEGKQYRVQVYTAIRKVAVANVTNLRLVAERLESWFKITAVDGRVNIDPARFLPDMTQLEFVNAIFKLFNLYYQVDEESKKILLYTRDEWFALNRDNVINLSPQLNLDDFEETPLTQKDVADTYYKWATDESDYLLTYTDYMSRVNSDISEDVYELPFAPLAFLKKNIVKRIGGFMIATGYDLIPAAIPATDIVDASVLEDFEASSNFSYKPKLALYYGSGYLAEGNLSLDTENPYGLNGYYLMFDRTAGLTGGYAYDQYGARRYKRLPKLTFFNVKEQPGYEVELITATREFRVVENTSDTIYTTGNTEFITSVEKADELDSRSIAMIGGKSIFQEFYENDLLVTYWSNYIEGQMKINPILYEKLNGRNIIRIDDDLFLLESISNYDLTGNTARIRLYKLVSS